MQLVKCLMSSDSWVLRNIRFRRRDEVMLLLLLFLSTALRESAQGTLTPGPRFLLLYHINSAGPFGTCRQVRLQARGRRSIAVGDVLKRPAGGGGRYFVKVG